MALIIVEAYSRMESRRAERERGGSQKMKDEEQERLYSAEIDFRHKSQHCVH